MWLSDKDKESIENFDHNTKRMVGRCSLSIKVDGTGRVSCRVADFGINCWTF